MELIAFSARRQRVGLHRRLHAATFRRPYSLAAAARRGKIKSNFMSAVTVRAAQRAPRQANVRFIERVAAAAHQSGGAHRRGNGGLFGVTRRSIDQAASLKSAIWASKARLNAGRAVQRST